ncbi:pyridoxal phosphate-dependent aminotransferase [Epidermidibacterium keratini]|uniref:Pyridoxal phosphate-dependent aminotransferase n=1 Tax=Epidermidibacterium keratini TaxID=1891644 RepID=A0A7L4YRB4_9ACTN|nr:pyridoxal phosphate-dependent aminotransferase [Epidermidibacterium keratini]QHC01588.1 pyridoxal phosphate-dependent aminotransferase [Epidermidibacterium keratini]
MTSRPLLTPRLQGFTSTIFAEMSQLAFDTDSINLGQGFPDTDGPDLVKDAAIEAIRDGVNQYSPGPGHPDLRAAIAEHQQRFYGIELDAQTQTLVTVGATEGISASMLALLEPGDEVVVLEPYYDSYAATISMAGGVRRPVTLRAPDFTLPREEYAAAITDRTRMLLLNTPHNPTGAVLSGDDLRFIADLAVRHDLLVVSDEVYEHMSFDGLAHIPIASLPGMAERTVTISSGGKTFGFTGWKIGWVTGTPELVGAVRAAKQFLTYVGGAPFQPAIAAGLRMPADYFSGLAASMQSKRDRLREGLAAAGFEVFDSKGTYFISVDARSVGYDDGIELCRDLPGRCGVVAIPMSVFYDDQQAGRPLVRFAFCKRDDVLDEAAERLQRLR